MSSGRLTPVLLILALTACGACAAKPRAAQTASDTGATHRGAQGSATQAGTTRQLDRRDVQAAIDSGLGALLRNVSVEDWPVMRGGAFFGFRLRALNPGWKVPLRAGDIIVAVNGMPIEHPEDADAALRALATAPELRVDYEREGARDALVLPIVGAPLLQAPKPTTP